MGETLLILIVLVLLFGSIYGASVAALQLFALTDMLESGSEQTPSRRRFWDVLATDPRDVLLAAEMFKSLLFALIIVLVIVWTPRWCQHLGLPSLPILVAALIAVWLANIFAGDVLPKRVVGKETDRRFAATRLAGLTAIWWTFRPALRLAEWITHWRPAPRRPAEREEIVERAIDTLAESAGMDEPVIEPEERAMIQGVIGLEDTEVREVMVPRINIVAIDVNAQIADVRKRTAEYGHSRLPVYDGNLDTIVGILYVKDLFCAEPAGTVDLATLARRAFVVPETKKVGALLEEFKRTKTHVAIVVDEFGGTAGLVTLEDILEEIVGEIEDEHEQGRRAMERVNDDVLQADGVVPMEEIAEALGIDLPDERFATIGGLIYDRVGGVPKVGQSIHEHGLSITIEQMDGQRIRRVRVSRQPQPSES